MPLKVDETDTAILRELFKDARSSLRQIAKETGLSIPTVADHIKKMTEAGIILGYMPIVNTDKICHSTSALLQLHVELTGMDSFLLKLSKLIEVRSLFRITGESNILIRLFLHESKDLESFISANIAGNEGVRIVSSQIITQTVKDDPGAIIEENFSFKLECDYCKREILTTDAIIINVGESKRFLCCTSCEQLYRSKYLAKKPLAQTFS